MVARKSVNGSGHVRIEAVVERHNDATEKNDETGLVKSEVVSIGHVYPFRFIVPERCTSSFCRWIYPVTLGGGLVGGDSVGINVGVGNNCACVLTGQESTKVYHCNHSGPTKQSFTYTVGKHAFLCVLQDPVVCFKGANFEQRQVINLSPTSSLVYLDWTLSGRNALSESWAFQRYFNAVEIHVSNELILREVQELEDTPYKTVLDGMENFQVCGMCVAIGPLAQPLCDTLSEKYSKKLELGERLNKDLLVSVSRVSYVCEGHTVEGIYLRFMAVSTSSASEVIRNISSPLIPILGADPYENKL